MAEQPDLGQLGEIGLIGAGALGTTLARALTARGAHVAAISTRRPAYAEALAEALPKTAVVSPREVARECDLVLLAVPDDAIGRVASELAWQPGQAVVHLSGARGLDLLGAIAARGAATAALHPLMTFPQAELAAPASEAVERLRGCTWALEASDPALEARLRALVAALDGHVIELAAGDRVAYHAAAVLASNYVVVLIGAAVRMWESFGLDQATALRAMLPLLRAAVDKVATDGLPAALSGPVARGDVGTIAAHLAWLDALAIGDVEGSALRDAYRALALLAIPLAEEKGTLAADDAKRLRVLLEG
jgi:predicted short-subunit dehydrogenase-like oxidoreductase (DUF2520 family)